MGWFSRSRCRRCGQFSSAWHRCRAGQPSRTVQPTYVPALEDMFPHTPIRKGHGAHAAQRHAQEVEARYAHFKALESTLTPAPADGAVRMTVMAARSGGRYDRFTYDLGEQWTPEAAYVFSHGHCHSLALALADRGYVIAGAVTRHALPGHQNEMAVHFYAVDPHDATYGIDIYGRRPVAEILADFHVDTSFVVKNPRAVFAERLAQGTLLPVDEVAGARAAGWVLSGAVPARP